MSEGHWKSHSQYCLSSVLHGVDLDVSEFEVVVDEPPQSGVL